MLELFKWSPRPGMSAPLEPDVNVIKFGDGYEQRQPSGINNKLRKYKVTFRVMPDEALLIDDFLYRHGAVTPFLWTPPFFNKKIKVVCRKHTPAIQSNYVDITCDFDEVLA